MQYNKMKNILLLLLLLLVTKRAGCGAFAVFSGSARVIQNDRTGAVYTGRVYNTYQHSIYVHRLKIYSIYEYTYGL